MLGVSFVCGAYFLVIYGARALTLNVRIVKWQLYLVNVYYSLHILTCSLVY